MSVCQCVCVCVCMCVRACVFPSPTLPPPPLSRWRHVQRQLFRGFHNSRNSASEWIPSHHSLIHAPTGFRPPIVFDYYHRFHLIWWLLVVLICLASPFTNPSGKSSSLRAVGLWQWKPNSWREAGAGLRKPMRVVQPQRTTRCRPRLRNPTRLPEASSSSSSSFFIHLSISSVVLLKKILKNVKEDEKKHERNDNEWCVGLQVSKWISSMFLIDLIFLRVASYSATSIKSEHFPELQCNRKTNKQIEPNYKSKVVENDWQRSDLIGRYCTRVQR